jgi:hypothetical protein
VADLAREVLGGIDLDPASCERANEIVRATIYFDKQTNGYTKPWHYDRVFVNPPGGWCDAIGREFHRKTKTREACTITGSCGLPPGHTHVDVDSSAKSWWFKAEREWRARREMSLFFVIFDLGLLQTSQVDAPADANLPLHCALSFPRKRVPYVNMHGGKSASPPHPSCFAFMPKDEAQVETFRQVFSAIGEVVVPR